MTPEEREALGDLDYARDALARAEHDRDEIANYLRAEVSRLRAVVAELRATLAEAWDAGWRGGVMDECSDLDNPYRAALLPRDGEG